MFRGIFVAIGTGLLAFGPWVEIVFAVIVAWTAVMMLRAGGDDDEEEDYSKHMAYRFAQKLFPANANEIAIQKIDQIEALAREIGLSPR